MKTKMALLLILFANVSCVNWRFVFIENKTDHDIYFHETITIDWPKDSSSRKVLLKFYPDGKIKQGKLIVEYSRICRKDSIYYLNKFFSKRKSKDKLIDSSYFFALNPFIIISSLDTTLFTSKEIVEKVNKLLIKNSSNTSVKTSIKERSELIWELNDSDLLK